LKIYFLVPFLSIFFIGCSTILAKDSKVKFTSVPTNQKCIVYNDANNTVAEGTTPFTAILHNNEIVLKIKCANGSHRDVETKFNEYSFGSAIFGVVGLGIDAISGDLTAYYDTNITTLDTDYLDENNQSKAD